MKFPVAPLSDRNTIGCPATDPRKVNKLRVAVDTSMIFCSRQGRRAGSDDDCDEDFEFDDDESEESGDESIPDGNDSVKAFAIGGGDDDDDLVWSSIPAEDDGAPAPCCCNRAVIISRVMEFNGLPLD